MNPSPNAPALAAALAGVAGEIVVEARDRLAVLRGTPDGPGGLRSHRDAVVALARQHGFTHVCVELVD